MKILIAHSSSKNSGIITFMQTVGAALKRAGHSVSFFIDEKEPPVKETLIGFQIIGEVYYRTTPKEEYELILLNSNAVFHALEDLPGLKNFVIHGLMDGSLLPPEKGIDYVTCLSLTSYKHILTEAKKILFANAINTEKYKPEGKPGKKLQKVLIADLRHGLYYCHKIFDACSRINAFCSIAGITGYNTEPRCDMVSAYNAADLVIGYGRVVYEAMSCGRAAIVYGINGGDGYMNYDTFYESYKNNCSGWALRTLPAPGLITVEEIVTELKKYNCEDGETNREMIMNTVNIDLHIHKILPMFSSM